MTLRIESPGNDFNNLLFLFWSNYCPRAILVQVTYEMITGRLPFHGASYEELFDAILKKEVAFPPTISDVGKVVHGQYACKCIVFTVCIFRAS